MESKIPWLAVYLDDLSLVYDKAEEMGQENLLIQLEETALQEARANSSHLKIDGKSISPEQFDQLPDPMKAQIIVSIGAQGLAELNPSMSEPLITVRLSPLIPLVQGCTFFQILHRLEKLDGAYNTVRFPDGKTTLQIQAPLGGKKGLMRWEMLIALLYPWLHVQEISTNEIAVTQLPAAVPAPAPAAPPAPKPQSDDKSASADSKGATEPPQPRKGILSRLFGKN